MIMALPRHVFDLQSGLVSRLEEHIIFLKNVYLKRELSWRALFIHEFTSKSCLVYIRLAYLGHGVNELRAQCRHPRNFFF